MWSLFGLVWISTTKASRLTRTLSRGASSSFFLHWYSNHQLQLPVLRSSFIVVAFSFRDRIVTLFGPIFYYGFIQLAGIMEWFVTCGVSVDGTGLCAMNQWGGGETSLSESAVWCHSLSCSYSLRSSLAISKREMIKQIKSYIIFNTYIKQIETWLSTCGLGNAKMAEAWNIRGEKNNPRLCGHGTDDTACAESKRKAMELKHTRACMWEMLARKVNIKVAKYSTEDGSISLWMAICILQRGCRLPRCRRCLLFIA